MTAIWITGTKRDDDPGETIVLPPNASMAPGDSFVSVNSRFTLAFQEDGNLVLLDEAVPIWATATQDLDATNVTMQLDGNLVIYDATPTALWASGTDGHPNSFLVLKEDGNVAIYNVGDEELAVMSIPPDWAEVNPETLEWANSVTTSPLMVEQRMGLRFSPRKMIEFGYTLFGTKRTYFDLLMAVAGGSPIYLPLFYENNPISVATTGDTVITVDTRWTELRDYKKAILVNGLFDHEVVDIWSYTDSTITLLNPLLNDWPAGTRIYPVVKVKIETPFNGQRYADKAIKGRMRFLSIQPNISTAVVDTSFGEFLGHPVLEREPNDVEPLDYNYERKMFTIDNNTGLQTISDVAPFFTLNYTWFVKRKQSLWELRGLFYALEGRRVPLWIPSYFADFELTANADAGDQNLIVKRCGYTDTGGPFKNREFILIHLRDGTRIYRQVITAGIVGDGSTEELVLDSVHGVDLTLENVLRISFLYFCRLDQDSVELQHHTDTYGLTTSTTVFRLDPGIEGINSWDDTGIDEDAPSVHPVFDPFRPADSKVWLYHPGFAGGAGDIINTFWQSRRSDAAIGFDGYAFPSSHIGGAGQTIQLPDTGSVLVRLKLTFRFTFGVPSSVRVWFHYNNSTLDDVSVTMEGNAFNLGFSALMQSDRNDIISSKIDPDSPITVQTFYQSTGGGNIFPAANNPDDDHEPFHPSSTDLGDSSWVIEWWA